MDFEEYVSANYKRLDGQTRELVEDAFKAGQQSKQAEIDELQKRINDTVDYADDVHSENWQETINTMLHILKGE